MINLFALYLAYNINSSSLPKVSACHYFYACPSRNWQDIKVKPYYESQDKDFLRLTQCEQTLDTFSNRDLCPVLNERITVKDIRNETIRESKKKEYDKAKSCLWFNGKEFFTCLTVKMGKYDAVPDLKNRWYTKIVPMSMFERKDWPKDNFYVDDFVPETNSLKGRFMDGEPELIKLFGIEKIENAKDSKDYIDKVVKKRWVKLIDENILFNKTEDQYAVQTRKRNEKMVYLSDGTLLQKIFLERKWAKPYTSTQARYDFERDFNYLYTGGRR